MINTQPLLSLRDDIVMAQNELQKFEEKIAPQRMAMESTQQEIEDAFNRQHADDLRNIETLKTMIEDDEANLRELVVGIYDSDEWEDKTKKTIYPGLSIQVREKRSLDVQPNDSVIKEYVQHNYPKLMIVDEKGYLAQSKLDNEMPYVVIERKTGAVIKKEFWEAKDGE